MRAKVIPEKQGVVPQTPTASPAMMLRKKSLPVASIGTNNDSKIDEGRNNLHEMSRNFFSRATRLPGLQKRNSDPPNPIIAKRPSDASRKGSDSSIKRRESTASVEIADSTMNDETHIHTHDRTVNFSRDLFALRSSNGKRRKSFNDKNTSNNEDDDDHTTNLATTTLILLFIVGIIAGLINGLAIWASKIIGQYQVYIIQLTERWDLGIVYFTCTTVLLASFAAYLCTLSSHAVFGSGMPEMKALLASDFSNAEYPKIVSWRIMFIRLTSLILALGSGLSVGSAGPLVHVAACVAYILMKFVPEFGDIFDSPSQTKQIFAASAAVGLTAVFNAPVGGLLFSVEVTSTFYLISNYWKSFMAATASAVMFNLVLLAQGEATEIRVFTLDLNHRPFLKWEFCVYIILGIMVGYLAKYYLRLHQAWWRFIKSYTSKYPISTAALVGMITAVLIYSTGAYTDTNVGVGAAVLDALTTGTMSSMRRFTSLPQLIGIPIMFFVRVFLTMIATNLRIPAGLFTPMFLLGAQFGRFFGVVLQTIAGSRFDIYITGYAMVGAVAFVSGITHTISAAVIAIELTGQLEMLLPCLIGAVVASGITKNQGLSLYDQGMVNKGLESFQLLIMGAGAYRYANDIVDREIKKLTRTCTIRDIFCALETKQNVFPVINNLDSNRLIGSLTRHDAFYFLKKTFGDENLGWYVREKLPMDTKDDDEKIARVKAKANYRWLRTVKTSISFDVGEVDDGEDEQQHGILRRTISSVGALFGISKDKEGSGEDSPVSSAKKKTALELLAKSHMSQNDFHRRRQYYSEESDSALTTGNADIENQAGTTTTSAHPQSTEASIDLDPEGAQKAKEAAAAAMLLNAFVKRRTMNLANTSMKRQDTQSSDVEPGTPTNSSSGAHLINLSGNINRSFSGDDFTSSSSQFSGRRLEESPSPNARKTILPPLQSRKDQDSHADSKSNDAISSENDHRKLNSSSSAKPARTSFTAAGGGDSRLDSVMEHGDEDDLSDCPERSAVEETDKNGTSPVVAAKITKPLSLDSNTLNSLKERRLSKKTEGNLLPSLNVLSPGHRRSIARSKGLSQGSDVPSAAFADASDFNTQQQIDSSVVSSRGNDMCDASDGGAVGTNSLKQIKNEEQKYSDEERRLKSSSDEGKKPFLDQSMAKKYKTAVRHGSQLVVPDRSTEEVSPMPNHSDADDSNHGKQQPNALVANAAAAFMRKSNPVTAAKLQTLAKAQQSDSSTRSAGMIARLAKVAQNVVSLTPKTQRPKCDINQQQMQEKLERLLSAPVDVVKEPLLPINAFPFTAHERTPMEHIYVLFEMVKVTCVFIIDHNKKLTGMISKDHLLRSLKNKDTE